ncbi:hypothetical protein LAZ67_2006516 [Cordylochernes scorpioides]|uniref:Peroxidase n=1 Tax=Cordylochernes scorpioides TaxID=51811 RepID=A0ABY6K712_9ARAC|nr:hypothetical protein LAZ67_2006516 [Cordylochernes scorpioides]
MNHIYQNGTCAGRLLVQRNNQVGDMLPPSANPNNDQCSFPDQNRICFRSGDTRVNQHPGITSTHVLWTRQHNRIADGLKARNPGWSDDKVFQETRRIIGAQIQMITYGEFLPATLGPDFMRIFNLRVRASGFTSYDSTTDPTLMNEFSTAAFRFGHSTINTGFSLGRNQDAPLRDFFSWPFDLLNGQMDRLFAGTARQPAQSFDRSMVNDVTDFCYRRRGNETGLDLASLNVQRGRDHGIPGYTEMLFHCFSHEVRGFSDLRFIEPRQVRLLQQVYQSVEDIDLFTGGVSETPLDGASVGPTFGCVIGLQFNHLKYGDRYYFEHRGQPGSFSQGEYSSL